MADLVTHLCSALLPAGLLGLLWPNASGRRFVGVVAVGSVLPDLGSRVLPLGLEVIHRLQPLPDWVFYPWGILHEPTALVGLCLALAALFTEPDRWRGFGALLLGCALHLGLDVLQDHHGDGYYLLAPCDVGRYELGWISSEASVTWAPGLALITAAVWWRARGAPQSP